MDLKTVGIATVGLYVTDDQGFSLELLHVESHALGRMAFLPCQSQELDLRRDVSHGVRQSLHPRN